MYNISRLFLSRNRLPLLETFSTNFENFDVLSKPVDIHRKYDREELPLTGSEMLRSDDLRHKM